MRQILRRLKLRLFEPVDSASLVLFRIGFGLLMLVEVYRYLAKGWIARYYLQPEVLFPFPGFGWVEPWPGDGMYYHFFVLGLAAAGMMLGWWYRFSAAVFFVGFTYVFLLDQARYLNHFYLICWVAFLMVWVTPHRRLSLAVWRRPERGCDWVPGWQLWLLRAMMGVVYFFGGVAKLDGDWLRGIPLDAWLPYGTGVPLVGAVLGWAGTPVLFAWGGLLVDLLAVPLLLWGRARPYMLGVLVVFHLMNIELFTLGIFPYLAVAMTLLFLPPSWPRRVFSWPGAAPVHGGGVAVEGWREKAVLLGVGLFAVIHLGLPLRHHLYPGDVSWTEEGHYFAWRMKLRDKWGEGVFVVTERATGRETVVDPDDHLSRHQRLKVKTRPHLVQGLARYLAARAGGADQVAVRARIEVQLNFREAALLVDPEVDLGLEPVRVWGRAPWILVGPRE